MTKKKSEELDYKKIAEELAAENASLNEALLRERADATNVRRRAEEERAKLSSFFKANVVKELLGFIDNLHRALAHAPKTDSKEWSEWFRGVEKVEKQLSDALAKIGVEKIKTVGEPFNPELHDAVSMDEGDGSDESVEVVSEELQAGYKLGDEVIRPAMVRVRS